MEEIAELIARYGGLIIMASLFVWVFIQDRSKNTKLLEELSKTNADNSRAIDALVESNKNIATSLEIIKGSLEQTESKIDRTYEELLKTKECCRLK
jgi:peptidoglycan hydrolase CwlO-like protein